MQLNVTQTSWPIRGSFTISRGSRTQADVVTVELTDEDRRGRGECVPYARYGESPDSVVAQIEQVRREIENGLDRVGLQRALPAGAARNALDCALWDLEAKKAGCRVWQLPDIASTFEPVTTAYTLSLDTPAAMKASAAANRHRPLLKVKLGGGDDDADRIRAVRSGAPTSQLILDANEAWDTHSYKSLIPTLIELQVGMIEQPFPADNDAVLDQLERPIPICADESCHAADSLPPLAGRYDMVNIKLDKTGGLTEALRLRKLALENGMRVMVGCMLGTSLAMAPACMVAQGADIVDLDGPLLLERDRPNGLVYRGSAIQPWSAELWG